MNREKPTAGSLVGRRNVLALIGAVGTLAWGSARGKGATGADSAMGSRSDRENIACTLTPEQTSGPYYLDGSLNRSDVRSDTSNGSVKPGVPLVLTLRVYGSSAGRCAPLAGAVVEIWHCDASGIYSGVRDLRDGTAGKNFLRGYQVTDSNGEVRFRTIFPGRYDFRATHAHLKVHRGIGSPPGHATEVDKRRMRQEFTTQLYFDDAIAAAVYARPPYSDKARKGARNEDDFLFRKDGGRQLIVPVTETGDGYSGAFRLAIEI